MTASSYPAKLPSSWGNHLPSCFKSSSCPSAILAGPGGIALPPGLQWMLFLLLLLLFLLTLSILPGFQAFSSLPLAAGSSLSKQLSLYFPLQLSHFQHVSWRAQKRRRGEVFSFLFIEPPALINGNCSRKKENKQPKKTPQTNKS